MVVRKLSETDWEQAVLWEGFPASLRFYYPDDTFGCFDSDDVLLCIVGRIYCGTRVAFLEGLFAKPGYDVISEMKFLSDWISKDSKEMGIERLISYSTSDVHTRLYRSFGFEPNLGGLTQIVKVLCH